MLDLMNDISFFHLELPQKLVEDYLNVYLRLSPRGRSLVASEPECLRTAPGVYDCRRFLGPVPLWLNFVE
jgi:hypothetical protein